ncbi:glutathione peroxidase [Terracidiphilus gabretensis]|jgi:glutathione peroxidase|uniref:glutathione peroxidase n=1 Tax=Terracidiphilus gabretensis TaxID=1577687 RepID=UPI00071BD196|nr:glutathione peroxidase [Terracidiphilus gabretensis]
MSSSIYDIPVRTLEGADTSLAQFKGKVVLVVNVASKCGLTPQYEGLEKLYKDFKDKGFEIAGFPSNDFAGQEPGTNEEIATFCTMNYGVDFPMFDKIPVVGPEKHPLYAALIEAQPKPINTGGTAFVEGLTKYLEKHGTSPNSAPEILWNFEKFLVSKTGEVVSRYAPDTDPLNPTVTAAIEAELAA